MDEDLPSMHEFINPQHLGDKIILKTPSYRKQRQREENNWLKIILVLNSSLET